MYDTCKGLLCSMKTVNSSLDFFRSGFVVVCLAHEFLFNLFYDKQLCNQTDWYLNEVPCFVRQIREGVLTARQVQEWQTKD